MAKLKIILIIMLVFGSLVARAQTDSALTHTIAILARQPAQEKVYLHLDKQNYSFGDTIWYKAYTVIGQHHQLSALSGVLYTELYNTADSLITRQIIQLHSGTGWGDIPLPRKLKQGNYRIRAYTNWMRNFGAGAFFERIVRLGGIPPASATITPTQPNPDVQFFPEGGQLVAGVRSRVAFKAVSANGLGIDIKGEIADNEGNIITGFATQHLGMGVFAFIPQAGKTYIAKINGAGETPFTIELPKALEAGYTLTINNSLPDSIYLKIAVNDKIFNGKKNTGFFLVAQSNGKVYYTTQGKLDEPVYTAKVEKGRFPTGIMQFTLFTQRGEPLAERIAYIEGNDTLHMGLNAIQPVYPILQNVKLNLQITGAGNTPEPGSFSVAVTNEANAPFDENNESTINNNLLLTADLKGYIEQPNYYFANTNDKTRADLDVLMLTQGYRRFEWRQMLKDTNETVSYMPQQLLELEGTLKTSSGKPIPNGKVTLVGTKENLLRDTTADAMGNFKFTNLDITDTATLVLRARKENNGSNVSINVQHPDYAPITQAAFVDKPVSGSMAIFLQHQYNSYKDAQRDDFIKNGIRLKQVNITTYKRKEPDLSRSANLVPGRADQVIMGDQLGACPNLSDCLQGKSVHVHFKQNGTPYGRNGDMSIIVNGNTVSGDYLNSISSDDVYSIEILSSINSLALYGRSSGKGGYLIITLKDGSQRNAEINAKFPPPGLVTMPFVGFAPQKVFYSPKYNVANTAQQPDDRGTIYWNPNVITDAAGKATFQYVNPGTKGNYRIVIEGIDDNGNLARQVYRYKAE